MLHQLGSACGLSHETAQDTSSILVWVKNEIAPRDAGPTVPTAKVARVADLRESKSRPVLLPIAGNDDEANREATPQGDRSGRSLKSAYPGGTEWELSILRKENYDLRRRLDSAQQRELGLNCSLA